MNTLHEAKQAGHAALANAFDALFALYLSSERVAKAEHDRAQLILEDANAADKVWDEVAESVNLTLEGLGIGRGLTTLEGIGAIQKHIRELQGLVEKHEASRVVSHDIQWNEVNP